MKKIVVAGCFLLFAVTGYSQVLISLLFGDKLNSDKIEFGLDGGLNLSTIQGLKDADNLTGFNLGFYFDFKLKNRAFMINTGVIVKSPMGAEGLPVYALNDPALDNAFVGGTVTTKLRYFNVPVLLKYQLKNHIYFKGGVQLGLMNKAWDEFTRSVVDDEDLNYKLKTRDQYHPLDAGLAVGAGYRLMGGKGMNIGVQFYQGLVDIKIDDSSPNQKNHAFYLTAGIPIGKSSSPKK